MFEFDLQAFLKNAFQKPAAFVVVDIEAGADDRIAFLRKNQFGLCVLVGVHRDSQLIWRSFLSFSDFDSC